MSCARNADIHLWIGASAHAKRSQSRCGSDARANDQVLEEEKRRVASSNGRLIITRVYLFLISYAMEGVLFRSCAHVELDLLWKAHIARPIEEPRPWKVLGDCRRPIRILAKRTS